MRSSDILIVDDEVGIRELLFEILQDEGYGVALAENATVARRLREQTRPALVLLDIWMPDCDGITLLKEWLKQGLLNMPVIVMSGHATIDTAVEATKIGAVGFLEKPISLSKLLETVKRALRFSQIQNSQILSICQIQGIGFFERVCSQVRIFADSNEHILLKGQLGCGFEMVAQILAGSRRYIQLRYNELGGNVLQFLEQSRDSLVFVDEIANLDYRVQQRLIFLLSKAQNYNVRVICSTTQSLDKLIRCSDFDGRIVNMMMGSLINIPCLKDYAQDIPALAKYFLESIAATRQTSPKRFHPSAFGTLMAYSWPGNLEQFRAIVKSLAQAQRKEEISAQDVSTLLEQFKSENSDDKVGNFFDLSLPLREFREQVEKYYFEKLFISEQGNMSRIANKAGMERTHLYRKLRQLGIQVKRD